MRRLTATLVTAVLVAAVACGGTDTGTDTTQLSLLLFGGANEAAGYQAMLDAFEAEHPDVRVELTPVRSRTTSSPS